MKKIIIATLTLLFFISCDKPTTTIKTIIIKDTVLVYFTDTMPKRSKYNEVYDNFTENRKVTFMESRNWKDKTYDIAWFLWIDGEIAESNPDIYTKVQPSEVDKYKAKIMRIENARIPHLLTVWSNK